MKKGGISSSNALQQTIRAVGFFLSAVISVYTVLIVANVSPNQQYSFTLGFGLAMAIAWLLAGLAEYTTFSQDRLNTFARVWGYHALAMLYILFITGFSAFPFISCWGVLSAVTYVYYAARGVWINLALLWITALVDAIVHPAPNVLVLNSLVALSVSLVTIIFILFFRVQERDEVEFLESKKAELLERERLATLVNNIVDAVISVDREGRVVIYNAAVLNLLDTNASIADKQINSVLKLENENGEKLKLLSILRKSTTLVIDDSYFLTIGEERIRLELTFSPIQNTFSSLATKSTEEDGYLIILRDVTKAKSLEEERDEFISVVSHELRTPIAITEGAIDNARLIFERDASKKEVVKKTLHMAHEQVIFLSKMVNDLSTLSRAERGVADEAEDIDVSELVHALYDEYTPEAEHKGLTLNLSAGGKLGHLKVSRLYLQELLQNFITNSIKYTKEGHIDISVERKRNNVCFTVSDTGIGISKSDQAKVFQKFYRSEDYRTRETGGTGLGLYVAQKLSKKLGTEIQVKSRLNHGSTFWFELPVEK